MTEAPNTSAFDPLRPRLIRVAYRMLGSVADAEDIVQEAFLRWAGSAHEEIREPEAYLRKVVTRLCLDHLKSARHRRESYIGPWLPEPVIDASQEDADNITLPLMMALERLTPLERAAFLLHDVFGDTFEEIGETLGRDPATCRQLASRARTHVRTSRSRFQVSRERGREIASAFFEATRTGDMDQLRSLLAADVVVYADGGGKASAATEPVVGVEAVLALHTKLARFFTERPSQLVRYAVIDGLPGFVTMESDGFLQTTALQVEDGNIVAVYVVRNPDKLKHIGAPADLA